MKKHWYEVTRGTTDKRNVSVVHKSKETTLGCALPIRSDKEGRGAIAISIASDLKVNAVVEAGALFL